MPRQIPKRPQLWLPILTGTSSILVGILPVGVQQGLIDLGILPIGEPRLLPAWATWIFPLASVMVLAGYATWIQWIDRRRYECIFDEMMGDRKKFHFSPLPEIVIQDLSPVFQKVARYGRDCGSYILDSADVNLSIGESIGSFIEAERSNDERFVKVHGTKYLVHPELIK